MIMDMPQNIDNLDVAQALQQPTEVVSITLSTQALTPADLLVSLHNAQTNAQATSSISQALSKAIALGPLSVSIPAPMSGGGDTQPTRLNENVSLALLDDEEGWLPPVSLGSGGSGQPGSSNINFALLDGEAGWLPPVPMTGGSGTQPEREVSAVFVRS